MPQNNLQQILVTYFENEKVFFKTLKPFISKTHFGGWVGSSSKHLKCSFKNLEKSIWSREHSIQKSCKKWQVSHIKVKVKELKCGAEIDMNLSMLTTRSGHMLVSTEDAACQTDSFKYEQPIIRIQWNCTEQRYWIF